MPKPLPVLSRLRELLTYDQTTGRIRRVETGAQACRSNVAGYLVVSIDGVGFMAHRVAFKMMTGRDPDGEIDHINRVRDDNRWVNLRDVTRAENLRNRVYRPVRNRSDIGVSRSRGKWRAYISKDGRNVYLGTHETKGEAQAAYVGAATVLGRDPGDCGPSK